MPYTASDDVIAAKIVNSSPRGAIKPAIKAFKKPVNNAVGRSANSAISKLPVANGIANAHSIASFIGAFTFCSAVNSASRNNAATIAV